MINCSLGPCSLGPCSQISAAGITGLERCHAVICCYFWNHLMHCCAFPQIELFRNLGNCEKFGFKFLKQSPFLESWHCRNRVGRDTSRFVLCILRIFPKPALAPITVKCILVPQQHWTAWLPLPKLAIQRNSNYKLFW